jgi:hypothetical protein
VAQNTELQNLQITNGSTGFVRREDGMTGDDNVPTLSLYWASPCVSSAGLSADRVAISHGVDIRGRSIRHRGKDN